MESIITIQGRELFPKDIQFIQDLIENNPSFSRRKLSQELCKLWNWQNAKGVLKDMACRSMMVKLDQFGYIRLPQRRKTPVNRMTQKVIIYVPHDKTPIVASLKSIQPLGIIIPQTKPQDDLFSYLLSQYHYLGYKGIVGENMKYMIFDRYNRMLCCLLFGSAAWKARDRDRYIGWKEKERKRNLNFTTNNMRFLILPWVWVKYLASHILGLISRRINRDWMEKYGHPLYLLETFVQKDRFSGTCYKAANWICVGQTAGRSRNDRYNDKIVPVKDIYLYPLISDFKDQLTRDV
jgi:hypothetical protein